MFKKEMNFISDLNFSKLQVLGDRFTIEDIKKSNIHPALFHYISANVDHEIFSDRKKIENSSIFNYSSDRVNNYFSLIAEEIKRTQRFDSNYTKQILQNAIVFNINYLMHPNKTLIKLIFSDSDVKSVEEIVIGISHAYYYRFLQKILFMYLDKKKVLLMSRSEFSSLLNRIDTISKETHLDETIATAVNSMANFFDSNSKISERLPFQAIKFYLEAKELSEFVFRLENKFNSNNSTLFLANDIIKELKSVTPEIEIEIDIKEIIKTEDDLVTDDSENETFDKFESETEIYKAGSQLEEIIDNDNKSIIGEEIFEVDTDDLEIPNSEILSSDENIERNDESVHEVFENIETIKAKHSKDIDITEGESIETQDFIESENPNDEGKIDKEEDFKKKNNTSELLTELVDINPIYESLLPSLNPFDISDEQINSTELIDGLSDETTYQMDLSTVKEEIDIVENNFTKSEDNISISSEIYQEISNDDKQIQEEYRSDNDEDLEKIEEKTSFAELVDNDNIEIETTDEVINEELIQNEFLNENKTVDRLNIVFDEEQELANLTDESNHQLINEDIEEVTEIFPDLAYLDEVEIVKSPIDFENELTTDSPKQLDEPKLDNPVPNNNSLESSDSYEKFAEILASKDMTKIIETVFDYDMEDYHFIIEKISEANSENEAIGFTNEYCENNQIELSVKEVELFKSLISDYFSKAYS